jgi:alkylation response protein AidB-like acyl-CoA dehydrogenase
MDSFGRFFEVQSSIARVRAAEPLGFDAALWHAAGQMGLFAMRVCGESGMGLQDAALVAAIAGKHLASGPLIEGILAARLLSQLAPNDSWAQKAAAGEAVVVMAPKEAAEGVGQLVPGGAVADAVVFLSEDRVICWEVLQKPSPLSNHADQPLACLQLAAGAVQSGRVLAEGAAARAEFLRAIEEWKLLTAAMMNGIARQAIVLAAEYVKQRVQFGRAVGSFQGVSHPLADRFADVEGADLLVQSAIAMAGANAPGAGAEISMAYWWSARSSSLAVQRALHSFGGYGLTKEYDIQLYHRRAKGLALLLGDPVDELLRVGARAWRGEAAAVPETGPTSIDFSFDAEAEAFAAETRAFFNEHLTDEWHAKSHYSYEGHDWALNRALGEQRLLFPTWGQEHGGRGASAYAAAAALEVWDELGVTSHAQSVSNMVGHVIARFGSEDLKARYLPDLAAGRIISSLGYSEPGSGSDVFAARTRAVRDGNDWLITGQKMFTSGANLASHVLLLTRSDPEATKHEGVTLFIVPLDAKGVEIRPIHTYQDERTNTTFYTNVRVPDSNRVGRVHGGSEVLAWALSLEQGGGGFYGPHGRLVESAVNWAKETRRGSALAIEDSRVLERLARARVHARVSQLLYYRTLWLSVEGKVDRAAGPMSKVFSSEYYLQDATDLFDLTAPCSLLRGKNALGYIEQCARHASVTTIYAGTSEVHRSQVAEKALGLPRSR